MRFILKEEVVIGVQKKAELLRIKFPDPEDSTQQIPTYSCDIAPIIDEVEQYILNYCNISTIPAALKYVWINLTVDYLRYIAILLQQQKSPETSEVSGGETDDLISKLGSIKMGDTSIGFTDKSSSSATDVIAKTKFTTLETVLGEYLMNYSDSLNKFRRVVW